MNEGLNQGKMMLAATYVLIVCQGPKGGLRGSTGGPLSLYLKKTLVSRNDEKQKNKKK